MKFLAVRNFARFQHYKDRQPEWIKLYPSVLEDYAFVSLPDASKAHLLLIWALASRIDNKIPDDSRFIHNAIGAHSKVDLGLLTRHGFLVEWSPESGMGKREPWATRYVSAETRAAILARDNSQCVACGATNDIEIDHIVPISRGGTGDPSNLQAMCRSCNRRKRSTLATEPVPTQMRSDAGQMRSLEGEEAETETETQLTKASSSPARTGPVVHTDVEKPPDAVQRFLAVLPVDKRVAWSARIDAWLTGEEWGPGEKPTAGHVAIGLADYLLAGHTDFSPRHVRGYVAQAMQMPVSGAANGRPPPRGRTGMDRTKSAIESVLAKEQAAQAAGEIG